MERIVRFFKDEDGMELTEYAVVGALITLAVIGIFITWGNTLGTVFQGIVTNITSI